MKSLPFSIHTARKSYPFQAEPYHIVHYREYLLYFTPKQQLTTVGLSVDMIKVRRSTQYSQLHLEHEHVAAEVATKHPKCNAPVLLLESKPFGTDKQELSPLRLCLRR